jgi:hypothetical protein
MALSAIYLVFRQQLAWLAILTRDDAAKTDEILLLRHEIAILQPAGPTSPVDVRKSAGVVELGFERPGCAGMIGA